MAQAFAQPRTSFAVAWAIGRLAALLAAARMKMLRPMAELKSTSAMASTSKSGALTLLMLGLEVFYTYATQGFGYGFSANRGTVERLPMACPFWPAAAISGLQGSGAEMAAMLFVAGRAVFALLYYTGISFIRVPAFLVGTLSILYIVYGLVTSIGI